MFAVGFVSKKLRKEPYVLVHAKIQPPVVFFVHSFRVTQNISERQSPGGSYAAIIYSCPIRTMFWSLSL